MEKQTAKVAAKPTAKAKKFSDSALEGYYRKEPETTERAILAFLRDSRDAQKIVYGTKAINAHFPAWLDRETSDWDIFTTADAKKQAGALEKKLDKQYGGDFFSVEPAIHPGTFRVRSYVTGNVVADVSLKDKTVTFQEMEGINYASMDWLEEQAKNMVTNPETEFRRAKDRDTLQRIRIFRKLGKKRRSRVDMSLRGLKQ